MNNVRRESAPKPTAQMRQTAISPACSPSPGKSQRAFRSKLHSAELNRDAMGLPGLRTRVINQQAEIARVGTQLLRGSHPHEPRIKPYFSEVKLGMITPRCCQKSSRKARMPGALKGWNQGHEILAVTPREM